MKSWIMKLWLTKHDESEWPDLSICQPQDACHVTDSEHHPSKEVIEKMCSEDFFAKHEYKYVASTFGIAGDDDNCPKVGGMSDKTVHLDGSSEYQTPYTVEENRKLVTMLEAQKIPDDNESGYLCPVTIKPEDLSSVENSQENTTGPVGSKISRTQQAAVSSTETKVEKVKKSGVEHAANNAFNTDEGEGSLVEDPECITTYDTPPVQYHNQGLQADQHHVSLYENMELIPKLGRPRFEEMSSEGDEYVERGEVACLYQNREEFTRVSTTERNRAIYSKVKKKPKRCELGDQLVPSSDHLYANVLATMVTQDALSPPDMESEQSNMETIHDKKETRPNSNHEDDHACDDIGDSNGAIVQERNSTLPSWLKDPEIQVIVYV